MTDIPGGPSSTAQTERSAWLCSALAGLNLLFGFQQQDIYSLGNFGLALVLGLIALVLSAKVED